MQLNYYPEILLNLGFFMQLLLVTGLNRKIGIGDQWFTLGDTLVLTVLGQVRLVTSINSSCCLELQS